MINKEKKDTRNVTKAGKAQLVRNKNSQIPSMRDDVWLLARLVAFLVDLATLLN